MKTMVRYKPQAHEAHVMKTMALLSYHASTTREATPLYPPYYFCVKEKTLGCVYFLLCLSRKNVVFCKYTH